MKWEVGTVMSKFNTDFVNKWVPAITKFGKKEVCRKPELKEGMILALSLCACIVFLPRTIVTYAYFYIV